MIYAENILLCIAIPLLLSMFFLRGGARRFTAFFLLGMIVCLLAAYISGFINLAGGFDPEETSVFISPVVEEIMKFLPLLFFIFVFELEDDALINAAIGIGTGFATFENCCYILSFGGENIGYILIRGLAVGVMHLVSVLMVTICLLIVRRFRPLTLSGVLGALSLSVTFHALYNLLVSVPGLPSAIGYAVPMVLAVIIYIPYRKYPRN